MRTRRGGGLKAGHVGEFRNFVELLFAKASVEHNVDRSLGLCAGGDIGARHRVHDSGRGGGLVVEFDHLAHHRRLIGRGVDPVDPWAALVGIHRAGGAHQEQRLAVAERVEDRHVRVHQPDVGMDDGRHRLVRGFRIAVRNAHRMVFMQAQQHARIGIAEMVDDGIVQAAIAGAGVEAHIFKPEPAQHLRRHVRAPRHFKVRRAFWFVDIHVRFPGFIDERGWPKPHRRLTLVAGGLYDALHQRS